MSSAKGKSYMRDSARASWRAILQLLCVLLAALAIPAAVCRLGKVEETEKFNRGEIIVPESMRQELRKAAPEWVLIGNSMLNSRIDATYLRTLSGRNSRKVTEGATQSAVWFLFMKQIVTASGVKPKWVTVFFRETDLTWPDIRTGGKKNDELIAALDGPAQPEWQQVMAWRAEAASHGISGVVRTTGEGLKQLLPGDWLLAQARARFQNTAFELTEFGKDVAYGLRRMELNEHFSLRHLRHDLGSDMAGVDKYESGPERFDASPKASFLPHMLALGEQHGFKLHFHRVKRRSQAERGWHDSTAMQAYMTDLRTYLADHGCALTDESQDPAITLDLYADGDHISSERKLNRRYMDTFWQRVRPVISGGPAAAQR